ncbi:MAG: hypothetical protein Q4D98_08580 [Planctomycetia bacterium]|nr:hypothetical protein [Planctomycetia bacterium]
MTSPFNPYQQWLGFAGERPATYYELLGLKHHEKDLTLIAKTADEWLTKVRAIAPGEHFLEWEQLCTELQVAKNCLCNPKYKSKYDKEHPAPAAPAASPFAAPASPAAPVSPAAPTGQPTGQPMNPAMGTPVSGMPVQPGMMPGYMPMQPGMAQQPGMQPMYPGGVMYGGMMYPQYPGVVQQPGMMPQQPGMPVQQGVMPGMVPPGMPYGAYPQQGMPGMPPVPQTPAPQAVQPVSPAPSAQPVQPAMPATPVSQTTPAAPATANPLSFDTSAAPKPFSPGKSKYNVGGSASKSGSSAAGVGAKKAIREAQNTNAMLRNIIALLGLGFVGLLALMLMGKQGEPEVTEEVVVVRETPKKVEQDSSPELEVPDYLKREEPKVGQEAASARPKYQRVSKEMEEALTQVRDDLAQLNTILAHMDLKKAETLIRNDWERQEYSRLLNITQLVEQFLDTISKAMGKYEATTTVTYKGEEMNIVESVPGKLILRIQGKNVTFEQGKLQNGGFDVVPFLVDTKLEKTPDSKTLYGAYLAVLPNADHKLARRLWDEALNAGKDLSLIFPELERYADAVGEGRTALRDPSDLMKPQPEEASPEPEQTAAKKPETSKEEAAPKEEKKAAPKSEKKADPKETARQEELKTLFNAIRQDISWRETSDARKKLKKMAPLVKTDAEQAELDRLDALTNHMETFVTWVSNQMGSYQAMDVVKVNGEEVNIVEAEVGKIIVRQRGVNRTYTSDNLNPRLVEFLVGKIATETPDNRVLYGTYLAMDSEGDREKARKLWMEAKSQGFNTDLLMPELDVPLPGGGQKPTTASNERPSGKEAASLEVPVGEKREAALKKIREEFAKDYKNSGTREMDQFAKKLLRNASSPSRPADEVYVMLQEAVRVAQEVHRYGTAHEAYLLLQERFSQDTYAQRFDMISKAKSDARGNISKSEILKCSLFLGGEAIQRKKKSDANLLLNIAQANGASPMQVKQFRAAIATMK